MDELQVIENAFSQDDYNALKDIVENGGWRWGMRSRDYTLTFMCMELMGNEFVSDYLKRKIEALVGKEMDLVRCYANAQTFGQDGTLHEDADDSNRYTFVTYIVPDNIPIDEKKDHFRVRVPGKPILQHIPVNPNQGVFFPGALQHTGLSTSRFQKYLRISVVWMLRLKYAYPETGCVSLDDEKSAISSNISEIDVGEH
jgi:hypothetical protein